MKLSQYFLKTRKETPSDVKLISHKLMVKAAMIKQTTAGIYTWLPLGLRVLKKIENIVRIIHKQYGCQELLMPTIQPSSIWKKSGRYDDYGPEMLKFQDRNKKELLYQIRKISNTERYAKKVCQVHTERYLCISRYANIQEINCVNS